MPILFTEIVNSFIIQRQLSLFATPKNEAEMSGLAQQNGAALLTLGGYLKKINLCTRCRSFIHMVFS